jgi:hypothetical protein
VHIGGEEDDSRSRESMMEIAHFADKHLLRNRKIPTYITDTVEKGHTRGGGNFF